MSALYGLLAEFDNPTDLLRAAERAHADGFRRLDAFTPYPVEGLAEAIGFVKTRVPLLVFLGGLTGCLVGYGMQYYAAVVAYPLNIGGRPLNSWPAFIPVTFEMTVLLAALTAVLGMLGLNGLPRPHHPLFHVEEFAHATRDRFFLLIQASDPRFDLDATRHFLQSLRPQGVWEVPDK